MFSVDVIYHEAYRGKDKAKGSVGTMYNMVGATASAPVPGSGGC